MVFFLAVELGVKIFLQGCFKNCNPMDMLLEDEAQGGVPEKTEDIGYDLNNSFQ